MSGSGEQPPIDVIEPAFFDDPKNAFQWLHREAPVFWYDPRPRYPRPMWVISKWADVRYVSSHPEVFCSGQGFALHSADAEAAAAYLPADDPRFFATLQIAMDPPDHGRHRRLVSRGFTPRRVAELEPLIRSLVTDLLDGTDPDSPTDLVAEIALPVPLFVICDLLGVDRARKEDFQRWSAAVSGSLEVEVQDPIASMTEMFDFFEAEIAARKRHPADDLITLLVNATLDGDHLTDGEVLMWCWTMLVAGHETTTNLIGGGMRALLDHPDEMAKLAADPTLVPGAVEELLRWVTPTRHQARTATQDVEIGNVKVNAGDLLYMSYAAANRDPDVFADPYRLDVARVADNEHLALGFGEHFCLGAPLARLEARVVFEEILGRFPDVALAGEPTVRPSIFFHQTTSLPVLFNG